MAPRPANFQIGARGAILFDTGIRHQGNRMKRRAFLSGLATALPVLHASVLPGSAWAAQATADAAERRLNSLDAAAFRYSMSSREIAA